MLQKDGQAFSSQLWAALQTNWFYLPGPGVIVGLVQEAPQPTPRGALSVSIELFMAMRILTGSCRAPSQHLLLLIPPYRSDICGSHPGKEGSGSGFHIPRLLTVLSNHCGSTDLHASISRGLCRFPYLHIGQREIHKEVSIMHPPWFHSKR